MSCENRCCCCREAYAAGVRHGLAVGFRVGRRLGQAEGYVAGYADRELGFRPPALLAPYIKERVDFSLQLEQEEQRRVEQASQRVLDLAMRQSFAAPAGVGCFKFRGRCNCYDCSCERFGS